MNDLYTLLTVRDELEKAYEWSKKNTSSRHQWSGLLSARNLIHRMIQEEMDEQEKMAQAFGE